jgi:hypothetical protein
MDSDLHPDDAKGHFTDFCAPILIDSGRRSEFGEIHLEKVRGVWYSPILGVVSDIGSIAELWPADEDSDALLNFVLPERGERRRAAAPEIA